MQTVESLYKFIDTLVPHKPAYEAEGEGVGPAERLSLGHHLRCAIVVAHVHTSDVAVGYQPQGFLGDMVSLQILFHTQTFGIDVRGTEAENTVGENEYLLHQSGGRGEHEARIGVHPHRTRHIQAAIMEISPALGVMECTISGFSLRNTRTICHSERKSLKREIWRSIGTAMVRTPSLSAIIFSSVQATTPPLHHNIVKASATGHGRSYPTTWEQWIP